MKEKTFTLVIQTENRMIESFEEDDLNFGDILPNQNAFREIVKTIKIRDAVAAREPILFH